MKNVYPMLPPLVQEPHLAKERIVSLDGGLTLRVQLPVALDSSPCSDQVRVVAFIGEKANAFSWREIVDGMTEGARMMPEAGLPIELSPDDVYDVDEAGWWLLMRRGVVPTSWKD